jgi:hypothetical protein
MKALSTAPTHTPAFAPVFRASFAADPIFVSTAGSTVEDAGVDVDVDEDEDRDDGVEVPVAEEALVELKELLLELSAAAQISLLIVTVAIVC